MKRMLMALALVGGMFLVTGTQGQDFDPSMFKLLRPAMTMLQKNPAALIANKSVQEELKMDDDQKSQVKDKMASLVPGIGGGFGKGGNPGEGMTKMLEKLKELKDVPEDKLEAKMKEVFGPMMEESTKEMNKILKPEQQKRLGQIMRQQGGLAALTEEENAKELKLSDEQKTKITDISKELTKDVTELMRSGGGGKGGFGKMSAETREKLTAVRKEATDKAMELLTADQKSKWKEMTGEPFEMKREFNFPKGKNE